MHASYVTSFSAKRSIITSWKPLCMGPTFSSFGSLRLQWFIHWSLKDSLDPTRLGDYSVPNLPKVQLLFGAIDKAPLPYWQLPEKDLLSSDFHHSHVFYHVYLWTIRERAPCVSSTVLWRARNLPVCKLYVPPDLVPALSLSDEASITFVLLIFFFFFLHSADTTLCNV